MLDNTITLSVDPENDGGPVNQAFTRIEEFQNRSVYKSPTHSFVSRDTLSFYRTLPKKSGIFNGALKSSQKFSTDVEVPTSDGGTVVLPLIGEVNFSVPVGTSAAQCMALRQRIVSSLDLDALQIKCMEGLEI